MNETQPYGLWHLGVKDWMHMNGSIIWGPQVVMKAQLRMFRNADAKAAAMLEVRPFGDDAPRLVVPQ